MQKRILFGEKFQHELKYILEDAGFQLVEVVVEPVEFLKYERKRSLDLRSDVVIFHGAKEGYPNSIYSSAATDFGGNFFLKCIKVLSPNYTLLPMEQADKWTYGTDEEFITCLAEITELVKSRLLKWFDIPNNNPAGLDMSVKLKLEPKEMEANLREQIRIFEFALQRAKVEGETKDIERHERTLARFREELQRLATNKTGEN